MVSHYAKFHKQIVQVYTALLLAK